MFTFSPIDVYDMSMDFVLPHWFYRLPNANWHSQHVHIQYQPKIFRFSIFEKKASKKWKSNYLHYLLCFHYNFNWHRMTPRNDITIDNNNNKSLLKNPQRIFNNHSRIHYTLFAFLNSSSLTATLLRSSLSIRVEEIGNNWKKYFLIYIVLFIA